MTSNMYGLMEHVDSVSVWSQLSLRNQPLHAICASTITQQYLSKTHESREDDCSPAHAQNTINEHSADEV